MQKRKWRVGVLKGMSVRLMLPTECVRRMFLSRHSLRNATAPLRSHLRICFNRVPAVQPGLAGAQREPRAVHQHPSAALGGVGIHGLPLAHRHHATRALPQW